MAAANAAKAADEEVHDAARNAYMLMYRQPQQGEGAARAPKVPERLAAGFRSVAASCIASMSVAVCGAA